ncbi:uncharacterized protein LOC124636508 [Helicoverpa zea]|uniref:uncharacterized protein LOC124636508 n=1 Tax=Helicoverpa zea TaxID=7113 RepID=UPI001F55EF94|nr:uncharacterized protein LOC124636508 [Helicoverpa zea]
MPLVMDKCCFFLPLRKGCLIIGYLNLVGNLLMILLSVIGLAAASVLMIIGKDEEEQNLGAAMFVVCMVMLILLLVFLAFTIILLLGLHQHKRTLVKVYLIYALAFIVLSIIMFFANLMVAVEPLNIVKDIVSIVVQIYFWLVIRSFYLVMDNPEEATYFEPI